jgi:hypothetical protein
MTAQLIDGKALAVLYQTGAVTLQLRVLPTSHDSC